jgi:DNA-binding response OmpR family regulator
MTVSLGKCGQPATPFPFEAIMKSPIMLFDPDPVAAAVLATQLRHAGFSTYVAPDGASAISIAGGKRFVAIVVIADLTDSQMRHCLHQIRDADPEAWLIVISDPTLSHAPDLVRQLGADATMEVPFTVSDLARRLSAVPARMPASV